MKKNQSPIAKTDGKFSVALAGCGQIGWKYDDLFLIPGNYSHAAAIAANSRFYLAAVCDSDKESSHACASRYDVEGVFSSLDGMLESGPYDVVVIATPPVTHLSLVRSMLASSRLPGVVILEKPVAACPNEALSILHLSREAKFRVVLNYSRRFSPEITSALAGFRERTSYFSGFCSGGLVSNGTHWFDLLQMAGFRTKKVYGIPPVRPLPGEDYQTDVVLESESGSKAFLQMLPPGFPSVFEFTAASSAARFRLSDLGFTLEESPAGPSCFVKGARQFNQPARKTGDLPGNLDRLYENVLGILERGTEPLCSVEDGILPLRITAAARASAEKGGFGVTI